MRRPIRPGNTDPTPASKTFTVVNQPGDTTPPRTTIRTEAEEINDQPESEVSPSLERGRFKEVHLKLDKGPYRTASPFSKTSEARQTQLLGQGEDGASNTDPSPATYTWRSGSPRASGLRGWAGSKLVQGRRGQDG